MPRSFSEHPPFSTSWRALQIFCGYRMILALSLLLFFFLTPQGTFLGGEKPELYKVCALIFLVEAIFGVLTSFAWQRFFYLQIETQITLDVILLILMVHTSGGANSGLGVLIAISTTAATILSARPSALLFSVMAAVAVLSEELFSQITGSHDKPAMTQVGILSVTFMATALMGFYLSRRIIESEQKVADSMRGLASMEKLNEEIIQYMNTGVVVTDANNLVRLINRAAWIHLGMPESSKSNRLEQVSTPLARQLNLWRRKRHFRAKSFRNTATGPNLMPSFSAIGDTKENVIIFLEDTSTLQQQAQSLKLASLGRLTASIAHEIRNPLGALSHAAQLLNEMNSENGPHKPLIEIISKNTARVNQIIENIMKMSQRQAVEPQEINLSRFLPNLSQDISIGRDQPPQIKLQYQSEDLIVYFDQLHLTQILTNLIVNGARYSVQQTGQPLVIVMVGIEEHSRTIFIDVIDRGPGVPPKVQEKLFEPFFTTSREGTGLGLYLSKELCEANRARLDYIPIPAGGACFRVSFAQSSRLFRTKPH